MTSQHPHWDLVLEHCGGSLATGREYLQRWIATMLRDPFKRLPYLFLYGPQNSGKSTLHKAIALLFEKEQSTVRVDYLLTNASGFNQELAAAMLCTLEEADLSNPVAYSRLRSWLKCKNLTIFEMRKPIYTQPNKLHWIQCASMEENGPKFPGDIQVTLYVPPLDKEIPYQELFPALLAEIQQFRKTLGTRVALV